jgi:hypothetical protein
MRHTGISLRIALGAALALASACTVGAESDEAAIAGDSDGDGAVAGDDLVDSSADAVDDEDQPEWSPEDGTASDEPDDVNHDPEPDSGIEAVAGGPRLLTHFNFPRATGGSDRTITNELIRLINATPAGATIRGNFFALTQYEIVYPLIAAYQRNVQIRISIDGGSSRTSPAARLLATRLGVSAGYCGGTSNTTSSVGCVTRKVGGIAHSKFFTFSKTRSPDGQMRDNVVWFASYNATPGSGDRDSNNATTVYDAPVLYQGMERHQIRMQNQIHFPGNDYYKREIGQGYIYDRSAGVEVHISPEQDRNLVLAQLDKITPTTDCVVRVFQAAISDSMLPSVQKLVALQNKVGGVRRGCRVFFLANVVGDKVKATLARAGIELRRITSVHDKLFLVDARYEGSAARRKLVFTGSHNWSTKASWGNDELLVRIENAAQWTAFYAHFLRNWRAVAPR